MKCARPLEKSPGARSDFAVLSAHTVDRRISYEQCAGRCEEAHAPTAMDGKRSCATVPVYGKRAPGKAGTQRFSADVIAFFERSEDAPTTQMGVYQAASLSP